MVPWMQLNALQHIHTSPVLMTRGLMVNLLHKHAPFFSFFAKPNWVLLNCPGHLLGAMWSKGKLDLKCFPSSQFNLASFRDEIRECKPQKCSHRPSKLSDGRMKIPLYPFLDAASVCKRSLWGHVAKLLCVLSLPHSATLEFSLWKDHKDLLWKSIENPSWQLGKQLTFTPFQSHANG